MKKFPLHWQILIAILLGGAYGYWLPEHVAYVSWMGDLFMRLLKMVVIPLIFCSLIAAITGIRGSKLGRLTKKTVALYLLTTVLAILTGLFFVDTIRPGAGIDLSSMNTEHTASFKELTLGETLLGTIPENLFADLAAGNMVPIVIFAIILGVFLVRARREAETQIADPTGDSLFGSEPLSAIETLIRCFEAGFNVMMKITIFVLMLAPWGIFGIIAKTVAQFSGDGGAFAQLGQGLGLHFLAVFSALAFHMLITLSLCIWLFSRCNPWKNLVNMGAVILTAFSTASSNGTLPLSMKDVVKKNGVSKEVAGFVLPLGANVNMNGTALYECAVVLFVAQAYGIELTLAQQFLTVALVLLTTLGVAGIPMASLVMIVIVLSALGLPPEGIALVIAVDRPLDMCRTVVNVYGDTCCAIIVAKSEGETLNV